MNSVVISPFWQSVDEQWIGATLVVISLACLASTALFVARYRSVAFFLLATGFVFLSAVFLAPVADARSPKTFQLWLMSPATLAGLSLTQIVLATLTVFGSIRQEVHTDRVSRTTYKIRAWFVAALATLPSPVLLVFLFWIEQNLMISTREQMPVVIGLKVAAFMTLLVGVTALIASWLDRYRLLTLHFFTGLFLLLSGALLPCLTVKLSVAAATSPYTPNGYALFFILFGMAAMVLFGIWRQNRRSRTSHQTTQT